jgi:hypothetical protein
MMNTTQEVRVGQEHMQGMFRANQDKMDAWSAKRKNDRKETMAYHNEMQASIKKMEPNSGENEAVVERQEISKEEVAIHSLKACRSETAASQEATEVEAEKTEPDPGMMQSVAEHQLAIKEDAVVKPVKGRKKRHRGGKLAAGPRGEPKELTRRDCGLGES